MGFIEGTWTDAWAYYFGGSYAVSDDQRFELYTSWCSSTSWSEPIQTEHIATYSQDLAGSIDGYNDSAYVAGEQV